MRINAFCCGLVLCAMSPVPAIAAQCVLQLEISNVEWRGGTRGGYDVFESSEYPQTVHFKVLSSGDPCPFFVTFSSGLQGDGNRRATAASGTLEYEIYDSVDSRTILKELPAASSNEVLSGAFAQGQSVQELSYAIVVPPLQVRPAGLYTDSFQVTLYQGTPDDFIQHDARTVTLTIPVENVTELSLVGYGASFDPHAKTRDLDFGKLSPGKRMGFDLRVRSNLGYRITLESENAGVMRHLDPSVTTTVPYSLELGGTPVNLTGDQPVELSRGSALTGSEGEPHDFDITIGEMAGAGAGTYRDTIAVTVIAE